ncbi:MAG: hypothetical protein AAB724_00175, partial [Patescibacteria group bacterium]
KISESQENITPNCSVSPPAVPASLITTFIYEKGSNNYEMKKLGYNSASCLSNGLSAGSASTDGVYTTMKNIDISRNSNNPAPDGLARQLGIQVSDFRLLRIRPLYIKTSIKVIAKDNSGTVVPLPVQGYSSRCAGTLGNLKRVVEVAQTNPQLPPIFDYAVFNNDDTGLSHL